MPKPIFQSYGFPESKSLVICGDIHGDFNTLVNKICVENQMKDTVVIVAGDCGFGFEQKGYYDHIVKRNNKRMNDANNWIVFIRGNHDNPAYFDGRTFMHKRFMAIPDYSVVRANHHTVLCIGGAVSVDRIFRMASWQNHLEELHHSRQNSEDHEILAPNCYWKNESPTYLEDILETILLENSIDIVVTHTAPFFCELQSKSGLQLWTKVDSRLLSDIQKERATIDAIYEALKGQPVTHWCYGHFHQSWHSSVEGTLFKMLDIMELFEIRG